MRDRALCVREGIPRLIGIDGESARTRLICLPGLRETYRERIQGAARAECYLERAAREGGGVAVQRRNPIMEPKRQLPGLHFPFHCDDQDDTLRLRLDVESVEARRHWMARVLSTEDSPWGLDLEFVACVIWLE